MILNTDEFDAVIFDLDGTLFDSMWMWKSIDIEFLGELGIEMPDDLQASIEGMSFSETAVYFKERFHIEQMSLDQIKARWTEMAMDKYGCQVQPKKGVRAFVKRLSERKIPMAIASSNARALIDAVLDNTGMRDFFDAVVISCEVPRGKPAPDVYLLAAERIHAKPERCLVFEDIVAGIVGGKAAGMKTFGVEDDFSAEDRDEKMRLADGYVWDYDDILLV